ncbi:MAG: substrate-binding domain-containing protein, partial [Cyanobacteria bacterium J06632_22]
MGRFIRLFGLSLAATLLMPAAPLMPYGRLLAQVTEPPETFTMPESVPTDAPLHIDGDPSLVPTNIVIAERFAEQYPDTAVRIESTGSETALAALQAGEIDIAALGRPLTDAEIAAGLVAVPFDREKIAIIVGPENPFDGDLTFEQFAQIFRGEITDWS